MLPAGVLMALQGFTLRHACATADLSRNFTHVSNPVPLQLLPKRTLRDVERASHESEPRTQETLDWTLWQREQQPQNQRRLDCEM